MDMSGQLNTLAALHQGKSPWFPLDRRLGELHSQSACGGKKKTPPSLPHWEMKPNYERHHPALIRSWNCKLLTCPFTPSPLSSVLQVMNKNVVCCNTIHVAHVANFKITSGFHGDLFTHSFTYWMFHGDFLTLSFTFWAITPMSFSPNHFTEEVKFSFFGVKSLTGGVVVIFTGAWYYIHSVCQITLKM